VAVVVALHVLQLVQLGRLEVLDQALEMAPGDSEALLARGRCLAGLGRADNAAKDFEKAAADPFFKKAAMEELGKLRAH